MNRRFGDLDIEGKRKLGRMPNGRPESEISKTKALPQ
jgi:hypothetical protein